MSGKKIGKPTDNPKTERIGIRISRDDLEKLNYCSDKTGVSRADIIALCIRDYYEKVK